MQIFLTIFLFITFYQQVRAESLLHCLAHEELILHRQKDTGPMYQLNQYYVTQIAALGSVKLRPQYFSKICRSKTNNSLKFLKEILLHKKNIFDFKTLSVNEATRAYQKAGIKALIDLGPNMFFRYISNLQALSNDPHCFEREVPEIKYFMERYMHLQGEITNDRLLDDLKKVNRIFKKLKFLKQIYRRCEVFIQKNNRRS